MSVKEIIARNKEALVIPDGIAVIGRDGLIIAFDEAASRISGYSDTEIVGLEYTHFFAGGGTGTELIADSFNNDISYTNISVDILSKAGKIRNVLASITPVKRKGKIISVVFVFRDTFEMLAMAEELELKTKELIEQKNRMDAIFNSNIEGTFTIDNDWNITSFNNSAERITGFSKEEAVGKKCWEIFNSSICRNGCHMERTMQLGESTIGNELHIIRKEGTRKAIQVNSAILFDKDNKKIGAVETFIDISAMKNLSEHVTEKFRLNNLIGKSKNMEKVFQLADSVSLTDSSVLITGESGTGKELIARAIHLNSPRRTNPFVALNCSAFAPSLIESELFGHEKGAFTGASKQKPGRFELAQGGSLFLDEIGDLSLSLQTKLLRVLETREFERVGGTKTIAMDTRIIAATNKHLINEIDAGRFREDFYYRINVMNIELPPLRERRDDLPLLIDYFIKRFNTKFNRTVKGMSTEAFKIFNAYPWYGNIRELENVLEHAFILCTGTRIDLSHIPERLLSPVSIQPSAGKDFSNIQLAERAAIIDALKRNGGNKKKTAEALKINYSTLWRKMKKYHIDGKTEGLSSS